MERAQWQREAWETCTATSEGPMDCAATLVLNVFCSSARPSVLPEISQQFTTKLSSFERDTCHMCAQV